MTNDVVDAAAAAAQRSRTPRDDLIHGNYSQVYTIYILLLCTYIVFLTYVLPNRAR